MKKEEATLLVKLLKGVKNFAIKRFEIEKVIFKDQLVDFHPWADFKEHLGSFLIRNIESNVALWFVFNEWNPNHGFYLIVFPENRIGPLIEIQKISNRDFEWRYKPSKRDNRNQERKDYFTTYFGTIEVKISLPDNEDEVLDFIEDIFQLTENRIKADELSEDTPPEREVFQEGRRVERKHFARERNSKLIVQIKELFKIYHGGLYCQVCGFDFEKRYGRRGKDFIEAHHTRPLSELDINGEETKPEEIVLVCSNCHQMIHRTRPWLNVDELKKILI